MRLDDEAESVNIEDRRGLSMGRGVAGGGLGVVVVALVALLLGVDPSALLRGLQGEPPGAATAPQYAPGPPPGAPPRSGADDEMKHFVARVLGSTETTWTELFARQNREYVQPKLVLFSGAVESACGMAQAAVGPFYCSADQKVYIDLSFYRDLRTRFHAPGEFAEAYVIAHEVGHHVQNQLGIMARAHERERGASRAQANAISVRLELQADCLAGVWASQANRERHILEPGDMEDGLNAASQIGDDRLQMRAQGYVSPESFTHGTSAQRVQWFRTGLESGNPGRCNTFARPSPAEAPGPRPPSGG